MLLKVTAKEAYGINMKLSLCEGSDGRGDDWGRPDSRACPTHSSQIGNHEILFATLRKGSTYSMIMDYTNSIISLSSFYDCPHVSLKIAMSRLAEAQQVVAEHAADKSTSARKSDSEASLANFFDALSRPAGHLGATVFRLEPEVVYTYPVDTRPGPTAQSHVVTRRDFSIQEGDSRQVLLEIYYDSQFYDLEILIESRDAPELKAHARSSMSRSDMTKFKGSKRIFAELERGDYTFIVVAKMPAVSGETAGLAVSFFEYQLYAVAAGVLPNKVMQPASLNLLGLLGPKGKDFGQLVYLIPQTTLGPQEHIELEF